MHGRIAGSLEGRRARPFLPFLRFLPFLPFLPFALSALLPFCLPALRAAAQTPEPLDAILDLAGDYVAAYEKNFVGIVAEETYRQEVRGIGGTDPRGFAVEARG